MPQTLPTVDLIPGKQNRAGVVYDVGDPLHLRRFYAEEYDALLGRLVSGAYSMNPRDFYVGNVETISPTRDGLLRTVDLNGGALSRLKMNGVDFIDDTLTALFNAASIGAALAPPVGTALLLGAATTAKSSLQITAGVAPTAPVDGDIWHDGTNNIRARLAGITRSLGFAGVLNYQTVSAAGSTATNSTSDIVVPSMTLNAAASGDYLVFFSTVADLTSSLGSGQASIYANAVQIAVSLRNIRRGQAQGDVKYGLSIGGVLASGVTAGQAIDARFSSTLGANTITLYDRSLTIIQVA
jgi:hypothetical protein